MLTFIDKNEVYSERKFDEVSKHLQIFILTIKDIISTRLNSTKLKNTNQVTCLF